ncbi:MAG TPA: hypothetical protein VE224_00795 [Pseudolabrys sp.]|nr:hypothetical protein [Pseudolabrys sp.]
MAYAPAAVAARDIPVSNPVARRRGLTRRLLDALMAARMRQAEREIAAFVEGGAGRFTDETEREIERRFLSNPNRF